VPRSQTTYRGMLKVSAAATLIGLEAPPSTRNLEVKPYALLGITTDNTGPIPQTHDRESRVGGDVKYGINENLTADLTLKTDFAQVEVDCFLSAGPSLNHVTPVW